MELASNGWKARIEIRVIGGNKSSIVGRNPMGNLCLQLMQTNPGETVMNIQGTQSNGGEEQARDPDDQDIDPWQQLISRLFPKFFTRTGKITTYKVPAKFFKTLVSVLQKNRSVPVKLQEKVDKEIDKLVAQSHIEKLQECLDRVFVLPIVVAVKKRRFLEISARISGT